MQRIVQRRATVQLLHACKKKLWNSKKEVVVIVYIVFRNVHQWSARNRAILEKRDGETSRSFLCPSIYRRNTNKEQRGLQCKPLKIDALKINASLSAAISRRSLKSLCTYLLKLYWLQSGRYRITNADGPLIISYKCKRTNQAVAVTVYFCCIND